MKIKILNGILIVDILTLILILTIALIPGNPVRVALGLPLILFSPGYTLILALFPLKEGINSIEKLALCFGMSIAIVPLLGLGLNYTPWGISLNTTLYSVAGFILIMSGVALTRQAIYNKRFQFTTELNLTLIENGEGKFSSGLTLLLVLSIITAIAVLGYTVIFPKTGEKFTEFYILGKDNKAQDYPSIFFLQSGKVVSVLYGDSGVEIASATGKVTLGIINQEQTTKTYSVVLKIDGEQIDLVKQGEGKAQTGPIILSPGGKWESEIEFAPNREGDKQRVEFFLYKDDSLEPYRDLHFWIDVK